MVKKLHNDTKTSNNTLTDIIFDQLIKMLKFNKIIYNEITV